MQNGEPRDKVDLLLMGDGYTAAEMEKWHKDARRMVDLLFAASPFKERRVAIQGTPRRFQRVGRGHPGRGERRVPPFGWHLSQVAAACDLRRLRLRALRAGV